MMSFTSIISCFINIYNKESLISFTRLGNNLLLLFCYLFISYFYFLCTIIYIYNYTNDNVSFVMLKSLGSIQYCFGSHIAFGYFIGMIGSIYTIISSFSINNLMYLLLVMFLSYLKYVLRINLYKFTKKYDVIFAECVFYICTNFCIYFIVNYYDLYYSILKKFIFVSIDLFYIKYTLIWIFLFFIVSIMINYIESSMSYSISVLNLSYYNNILIPFVIYIFELLSNRSCFIFRLFFSLICIYCGLYII